MASVTTSKEMQRLAQAAIDEGNTISSTDEYQVYALPPDLTMEGYVLVLYLEGKDVSAGGLPASTLIVPVEINNRKGYLIHRTLVPKLA